MMITRAHLLKLLDTRVSRVSLPPALVGSDKNGEVEIRTSLDSVDPERALTSVSESVLQRLHVGLERRHACDVAVARYALEEPTEVCRPRSFEENDLDEWLEAMTKFLSQPVPRKGFCCGHGPDCAVHQPPHDAKIVQCTCSKQTSL